MNDFNIKKEQEEFFSKGAKNLIFPLEYIDFIGDFDEKHTTQIEKLPEDVEFLQFQGFEQILGVFWSDSQKQSYWIKIPFTRINTTTKRPETISINDINYKVIEFKILKYSEFLNLSQGHLYMNKKTYNRVDFIGNHKSAKSTHMFNQELKKYINKDFFENKNNFILIYELEKVI